MSLLVVGSIALDTVETPFGRVEEAIGGSATFFAAAASLFCPVQVVAVVGHDYPMPQLDFLRQRGVDLSGVAQEQGESFRWSGVYSYDLNSRETLETRLGVFEHFYDTNFAGADGVSTHYVVLGYEIQLDEPPAHLPADQHHAYRWWAVAQLMADQSVHANTKRYFFTDSPLSAARP